MRKRLKRSSTRRTGSRPLALITVTVTVALAIGIFTLSSLAETSDFGSPKVDALAVSQPVDEPFFAIERVLMTALEPEALDPQSKFLVNRLKSQFCTHGICANPRNQGAENKWQPALEKAWRIIELGRPVARISDPRFEFLPDGITSWTELDSWQGPQVKTFELQAKNFLGLTMASAKFAVLWNYAGRHQERGAYIANLTILPSDVRVEYTAKFNVDVKIVKTALLSTGPDPVAALTVKLNWTLDNVIKQNKGTKTLRVLGDGTISLHDDDPS